MTDHEWGRVDPDGTVWVRTAAGERVVGQYPGATPSAALAYFARKFDDLVAQVSLLEQRIRAGQVSSADAEATLARLRELVAEARAVGDLDGLAARVEAIAPLTQARRMEAEAARAEARERALAARTALVDEAEGIAAVEPDRVQWKASGDRLRTLFEEWRRLQRESRLDKHTEDELWRRFSHARTTFDRKRRQHFGALDELRSQARAEKERLVAEAERLAISTEWGPTAAAYRRLMDDWKRAGRAARRDDDELWARFRAAQDSFFTARTTAGSRVSAAEAGAVAAREAVLVEAEALVPVSDPAAARAALRDLQDRWDAAERVPRADAARLEARLRRVETAVREAEERRWARSNPEGRARAEGLVAQLEQAIASLESDLAAAQRVGDARRARDAEAGLAARREWLAQARRAQADFGG